jgi:hypothetical protein
MPFLGLAMPFQSHKMPCQSYELLIIELTPEGRTRDDGAWDDPEWDDRK